MIKNIPHLHTSQAPKNKLIPIDKGFSQLSDISLHVLAHVLLLKKKYYCVYSSLSHIAYLVKRERSYVGKIIRDLEARGFLELEHRPNKTHIYHPNKVLYRHELYSTLMRRVSFIAIMSLSILRSNAVCPQLDINVNNIVIKQTERVSISTRVRARGAQKMTNFTQEQLEQLSKYAMPDIQAGIKTLTSDLLAGKSITDQFKYLIGILNRNVVIPQQTLKRVVRQTPVKEHLTVLSQKEILAHRLEAVKGFDSKNPFAQILAQGWMKEVLEE